MVYQLWSNDDPRLTFDIFEAVSDLHPYVFFLIFCKTYVVVLIRSALARRF